MKNMLRQWYRSKDSLIGINQNKSTSCVFVKVSEMDRTFTDVLFEDTAEIQRIVIADGVGNFRDGQIRGQQHCAGPLDADFRKVCMRRKPCVLFKFADEVIGAHVAELRILLNGDILVVVVVHAVNDGDKDIVLRSLGRLLFIKCPGNMVNQLLKIGAGQFRIIYGAKLQLPDNLHGDFRENGFIL